MPIDRVEIRLLGLRMREPFGAAHGEVAGVRPLVVVRVDGDGLTGWGECPALPVPGYAAESPAGAFDLLRRALAPAVVGAAVDPTEALSRLAPWAGDAPMAAAAVEGAVLDAALRGEGRSLARWLGVNQRSVPAGAVVGLASDLDTLEARVRALVASGYRRVKVKIRPGWDLEPLGVLRSAFPHLDLHADANGAYRAGDSAHLARLDRLALGVLEQPFPPGDLAGAARLRRRLATPVALDEGAASPAAVDAALRAGAADLVVVKPARLGGLVAARAVHDRCRDAGVGLVAGGLLEAGLGRRVLAAVAALPGFTATGDCSPADRWLADDPWPPEAVAGASIAVHHGPGLAPPPRIDVLDGLTRQRAEVRR